MLCQTRKHSRHGEGTKMDLILIIIVSSKNRRKRYCAGNSSMTIESPKPPRPVQQPRVVDVSRPGGAGLTVEIDASEAAELLLSIATLLVDEEHDTYELGAARIEELRAAAPPELLRDADRAPPLQGGSAAARPGLHDAEAAHGSGLPRPLRRDRPVEIRLHLLGYYTRGHHVTEPETIRRAAEGDAGAIGELVAAYASTSMPTSARTWSGYSAPTRRGQGRAPRAPLGLVRARPARDRAGGLRVAPGAGRGSEARARALGSSGAGRRAARARHPVVTGARDRPRGAVPRVLAASVGLHERVQAREDLLPADHRRPRANAGRSGRARPDLQGARRREPTEAAEAAAGRADLAHGSCAGDRPCEVDHASPSGAPAPGRLRADSGGRRHVQAAPRHAAGARRVARSSTSVPERSASEDTGKIRACASPSASSPACGNAPAARASSSRTLRAWRTSGRRSGSATSRPASSTP